MAAIHELLKQISDPVLRERIAEEFERSTRGKKFGLVFENHIPERLPLYGFEIKRGRTVAKKTGKISDTWQVIEVLDLKAHCRNQQTGAEEWFPLSDLVAVADYHEPVYPALEPLDKVVTAPKSTLWHTLIEGENYYALQLLEYLYTGKVDCIYIDPPYNTGARDWKYNDDYVDGSDAFRHSKWLSMMKRRLLTAKRLLSENGCIFISIDDGEACALKLLCDDIFGVGSFAAQIPWRKRTAKSDVPFGISQDYESILCYANPGFRAGQSSASRKYYETDDFPGRPWRFHDLTTHRTIKERPNSNFSIINPKTGEEYPVNPLRSWAVTKDTFENYYKDDRIIFPGDYPFLKISKPVLRYWKEDDQTKAGDDFGITSVSSYLPSDIVGMTQNGTKELQQIFGDKRFAFPKPINLIKYLVQIATFRNPNALILDFFAGSGTTLHAVNLLNAEDGGNRHCIIVTNNEVSDAEAKSLSAQGFKPGNDEWEKHGIARSVTWPRTVCSIEGHDINGAPLKGNYSGSDLPMADGFSANCEFFHLTYLEKDQIALGQCFEDILPLLWLQSGAVGERPTLPLCEELPEMLILPENHFAVLIDEMYYGNFASAVRECGNIEHVYIVTNSDTAFKEMAEDLGAYDVHQLYRDYLENFRISAGRIAA